MKIYTKNEWTNKIVDGRSNAEQDADNKNSGHEYEGQFFFW